MHSDFFLPDETHLHETQAASHVAYRGGFLSVEQHTVSLANGQRVMREFIQHPGAVAVLAITADRQLVMERQFRYPMGQVLWELPAGKLDAQETPLQSAQRELREETGYTAQEWQPLGVAYPCIAYATEQIHYFLATGLQLHERALDEGEHLDVHLVPLEQTMHWAEQGLIPDSKTLVGLFWLRTYLARVT